MLQGFTEMPYLMGPGATGSEELTYNYVNAYATTDALYKAEHTDELEKYGKVHLRIDYKVSEIGFNS